MGSDGLTDVTWGCEMKKFLVFLCSSMLIFGLVGTAGATAINDKWDPLNPSDEENLCEIWNTLFGDNVNSSNALSQLADGDDNWWRETDGSISLAVRYAGYSQELGVWYNGNYYKLLTSIPDYAYTEQTVSFEVKDADGEPYPFMWVERTSGSPDWYSDTAFNSDGKDHFVAFNVTDQALIDYYNETWIDEQEDYYNLDEGEVWFIAFEDLVGLGDRDYNDLVFVAYKVTASPIPEPATILLFISGLIGLGGFRKKFRKI